MAGDHGLRLERVLRVCPHLGRHVLPARPLGQDSLHRIREGDGIARRHRQAVGPDLLRHAAHPARHHRRAAQERLGDHARQAIGEARQHQQVRLVILLGQRPRIEDAHELHLLGDTQAVGLPPQLRLQLRVVIHQTEMHVALLAKLLHRFEQEVDPLPVDQLADVEHVVARLVGSLPPMPDGAEDVGRHTVGNGVDLFGARHARVVPGLGARQRDVGLRPVHHVLEGVAS